MESSIAVFLSRRSACERPPTNAEIRAASGCGALAPTPMPSHNLRGSTVVRNPASQEGQLAGGPVA